MRTTGSLMARAGSSRTRSTSCLTTPCAFRCICGSERVRSTHSTPHFFSRRGVGLGIAAWSGTGHLTDTNSGMASAWVLVSGAQSSCGCSAPWRSLALSSWYRRRFSSLLGLWAAALETGVLDHAGQLDSKRHEWETSLYRPHPSLVPPTLASCRLAPAMLYYLKTRGFALRVS